MSRTGSRTPTFPFTALVGADELTTALLLSAISPEIGGVLVRGEKGTAKSTMVRALAEVLPDADADRLRQALVEIITDAIAADEEWRDRLSPEEFAVLRQASTEAPFKGEYTDTETEGIYACKGCGAELFRSTEKFHSHCGWPSFFDPKDSDAVITRVDGHHYAILVDSLEDVATMSRYSRPRYRASLNTDRPVTKRNSVPSTTKTNSAQVM